MGTDRLVLTELHPELSIAFDRWAEKSGSLSAEVTVETSSSLYKPLLLAGRLNLVAIRSRAEFANRLQALCPEWEWNTIIENACQKAIRHYRQGESPIILSKDIPADPITWDAYPLLFTGHPTVLFGAPGLGKSKFCLYLAMLIETGYSQHGFQVEKGRVLYLDWEASKNVLHAAAHQIWTAHPEVADALPVYRRMLSRLADSVEELKAIIAEHAITTIIVDSIGMACQGDLIDPMTAIKYNTALRTLGCTSLSIGHTPRPMPGQEEHLYGGIYYETICRSLWHLRSTQEFDDTTRRVGLFHRKCNLSKLLRPIGLTMTITPDETACIFSRHDLVEDPAFASSMPAKIRIQRLLVYGLKTPKEIAEGLGIDLQYVRNILSSGKGRWCVMLETGMWGPLERQHSEPCS